MLLVEGRLRKQTELHKSSNPGQWLACEGVLYSMGSRCINYAIVGEGEGEISCTL